MLCMNWYILKSKVATVDWSHLAVLPKPSICFEAGWGVSRVADIKGSDSEMLSKLILVPASRCLCLLKFEVQSHFSLGIQILFFVLKFKKWIYRLRQGKY